MPEVMPHEDTRQVFVCQCTLSKSMSRRVSKTIQLAPTLIMILKRIPHSLQDHVRFLTQSAMPDDSMMSRWQGCGSKF